MKRFTCIISAAALCLAMAGCAGQSGSQGNTSENATQGQQEQEQQTSDNSDESSAVTTDGADASTISSTDTSTKKKSKWSYGVHHAVMRISGMGVVQLEIYSNAAPKTAATFCKLVNKGYYNDKYINSVMSGLYVGIADRTGKTTGKYLVKGEFEEAGFTTPGLSLTRGVVAMSRVDDTVSTTNSDGTTETKRVLKSDASSLVVFTSDVSYMNGKYAGFAKVTKGIAVFDTISNRVNSGAYNNIEVQEDGTIVSDSMCPIVRCIRMVD